jgi:UPF0755 protein
LKKILILIIALLGLSFFGYSKYKSDIFTPLDPESTETISFQIKKGDSVKEIAKALEEKSLIKSDFSFYLYIKNNKLGEKLLAGRFVLSQSMSAKEIIEVISDPSSAEFVITIQEGLRIRDIDQKLVELELSETGDFEAAVKSFDGWEYYSFLDKETLSQLSLPLEGYIYPDTYFLDPVDFQAQDLIYLTLDNFERKTIELIPEIKNHSVNEIITMASIIENEVFGEEDRHLVSGLLWKRLESGWTIGADATLLYITDDRELTAEDLAIDSSYNTRKNLGLPIGPISNPSLESIKAAMYPEASNYWFYLTTLDTGEVIYSSSNEEHNLNRAKYL